MTLKIGLKDYRVIVKSNIVYAGMECKGLCERDVGQILLSPESHPDDLKSTLWHEILHGFEDFMGFDISEEQINAFAQALTLFIKENPKFMAQMISPKPLSFDEQRK